MHCRLLRFVTRAAPLGVLLTVSAAQASDFLDLRLSFNVTDENVLVKPGDTVPSIPGPRIGAPLPRWGLLFFDAYETRYTGFENQTNLVLYKTIAHGQEDFEGAFVLRFNPVSDALSSINDGGSYLKWTHHFDPTREAKTNVSLTVFPFSSDLFRLGYSYKISWGGSPMFFKFNPNNPTAVGQAGGGLNPFSVPGARVQFATERAYAFLGAKTSLLRNTSINELQTIYGLLAGGGYDILRILRVEANGGYFYRGVNPIQAVLGKPVQTIGASVQLMLHRGADVGRGDDLPLFKNDPTSAARLFQPEEYPGGLSWMVSTEFTYTATTLEDPSPGRGANIVRQPGMAADLNLRLKYNRFRVHLDAVYEDLSYLLINVPSFVPFQGLSPDLADTKPKMFAAAGVDYFFEGPRLTVGITAGVEMPATFSGKLPASFTNDLPPDAIPRSTTVVIRSEGLFDVLPPDYGVVPIYAAKLSAKVQFWGFSVLGEGLLGYDNNETHLQRLNLDPQQVSTRVFLNPWQLGFNLAFQARL